MSNISMELVKELRERTGAGMMDCKKALEATGGDIEKAIEELQKRGLAKAAKKAGRIATEGLIHAYIHLGGRIGVLVEVNCETDFVARSDEFKTFVEDVAMQIAAMNPFYVSPQEIPEEELNKQREIFLEQLRSSGKPEKVLNDIVEGKLKKWYSEVCLYNQPFIKNDKITVDEVRQQLISKTGENITVRRFVRFELGEGIEKKKKDLVTEVEETIKAVSGNN